ncbi:MAG: CvpA family protein [Bacteroidota bacterium]
MAIDIIFLIVAAFGFYLGFARGIISTVFTVISFTFGMMAAFKFSPAMTKFLEDVFNTSNPLMFIAGFLLSFVITMVFLRLIARGLETLLETAQINIINQVLGGVLLSAVMILVYSMLLWFSDQSHLVDDASKTQSFTYVYLKEFPGQVWSLGEKLKPTFEEFWDYSVDMMDRLEEMSIQRTESEPDIYDIEEPQQDQ